MNGVYCSFDVLVNHRDHRGHREKKKKKKKKNIVVLRDRRVLCGSDWLC